MGCIVGGLLVMEDQAITDDAKRFSANIRAAREGEENVKSKKKKDPYALSYDSSKSKRSSVGNVNSKRKSRSYDAAHPGEEHHTYGPISALEIASSMIKDAFHHDSGEASNPKERRLSTSVHNTPRGTTPRGGANSARGTPRDEVNPSRRPSAVSKTTSGLAENPADLRRSRSDEKTPRNGKTPRKYGVTPPSIDTSKICLEQNVLTKPTHLVKSPSAGSLDEHKKAGGWGFSKPVGVYQKTNPTPLLRRNSAPGRHSSGTGKHIKELLDDSKFSDSDDDDETAAKIQEDFRKMAATKPQKAAKPNGKRRDSAALW